MRLRIFLLGAFVCFSFLFVAGCRKAGTWLVMNDITCKADAIVLLTGSIADRVLQVSDLYNLGYTQKIIIVEAGMVAYKELKDRGVTIISNTTQYLNALIDLGIPEECILILPGDAISTQMEAEIIRNYIQNDPEIDTILLVSSSEHTRRASMIFRSAFRNLDNPPEIICSPSKYTSFNAQKWWNHKESIQTVLLEYLKMLSYILIDRKELENEISSINNFSMLKVNENIDK